MRYLSIVLALVALLGVFCLWENRADSSGPETAYARVMRTGTLRCGWYVMPPFFQRDPNTGAFSGIYYDLMEEVGRQLDLKINWTEEVSGATAFEGLRTKRYDVVCAAFAPMPARAKVASFTAPLSYRPAYAYVRANDMRFDSDVSKIDDPSIKISVVEGQGAQLFAQKLFPQATLLIMPPFSDLSQNEMNVATNKADVSIAEASTAERFMASNPGKIRRVAGPPLIMLPNMMQVGMGEEALKDMLNTTFSYLADLKFIVKVHEKYLGKEGHLYWLTK